MKKCMKFILFAAVVVTMVVALAACTSDDPPAIQQPDVVDDEPAPEPPPEPDVVEDEDDVDEPEEDEPAVVGADASHIQVALVAHSPESILHDGSFNEGAWAGVQRFLSNHGLTAGHAQFFQPHSADDETRIDLIADAVGAGANVVVLPGFHFIDSSAVVQEMFPDVHFILLDATPAGGAASNLAAIHYAEEQAGFLAGYAIVMEGHRSLGFMGGHAVPAVVRFGHGFLQGANHAAGVLGLEAGEITVNYFYVGGFAPDPGVATTAAAWFAAGTEVIFAAAGGAGFSVMAGAEEQGGLVIGVDVDQSANAVVITSAMKALDVSVYDMLTDILNDNFTGGVHMFDASINGVGLPMGTSRFQYFTEAQYTAIFAQLASGAITVNNVVTPSVTEAELDIPLLTVVELN